MCRLQPLGVVETIVPSSVAAAIPFFLKTSLCNVFFVCLFSLSFCYLF